MPLIIYKISKPQVNTGLELLKQNKYKDFDITPQHLGSIIRNNNITRKRTRYQHFPKERRKQLTTKNKEIETFYNEIRKYQTFNIV